MDARFNKVGTDPRFVRPKKRIRRLTVDSRFQKMFQDKEFETPVTRDKRGNKVDSRNELQRFYSLEDDRVATRAEEQDSFESDSSAPDDDFVENDREQVVSMGGFSKRIAIVNADWSQIGVDSLFKMCSSFKPKFGQIVSIVIYVSELGKNRMQIEERLGPPQDIVAGTEQGKRRLWDYLNQKQQYYYAVVECDSAETSQAIYSQIDGREFEKSGSYLDLRVVPDHVEFDRSDICQAIDQEGRIDEFTHRPIASRFTPPNHSNPRLDWDENDRGRALLMKKRFSESELNDLDFQAYLASSESETEEATQTYRYLAETEDKDVFDSCNKTDSVFGKSKSRSTNKPDKKIVDDNFEIDLEDDRFGKLYDSPHFAIDPSHPSFRKSRAMEQILEKKRTIVRKTTSV